MVCSTLGVADFIRRPCPAASTITAAGRASVTGFPLLLMRSDQQGKRQPTIWTVPAPDATRHDPNSGGALLPARDVHIPRARVPPQWATFQLVHLGTFRHITQYDVPTGARLPSSVRGSAKHGEVSWT